MSRTRITVDVDPEVRRRIRLVVADRDETIKDFLERAILRELAMEDLDGGGEEMLLPPAGVKPRGSRNPARPRGGGNPVSEAVIEDRR